MAMSTDPGDLQQQAYIRASLQRDVVSLKQQVKTLTEENEVLRRGRAKVEKDTHEFVAYFQKEMEKKDETIGQLKEKLRKLQFSSKVELKAVSEKYEEEAKVSRQSHLRTTNELEEEAATAKEALEVLREFKEERDKVVAQIGALQKALAQQKEAHEKEQQDIDRKFIEEKTRIMRQHHEEIKSIKKSAREEAQKELDADTRLIVVDNRRMGEELRFQQSQTEVLEAEKEEISEQNRELAREVELLAQKEKLYALKDQKRGRDIRDLKNKIKGLEQALNTRLRDADRERELLRLKHGDEMESLETELRGIKSLLKLKNKELLTMKRLAATIVSQRTEIEQFFLEALDQVKKEIKKQREARKARALAAERDPVTGTVKLPAIGPGASGAPVADGKVELRDLSWEDRERVLRLLFAKINSVETPAPPKPPAGGTLAPELRGNQSAEASRVGFGVSAPFGLSAPVPGMGSTEEFSVARRPASRERVAGAQPVSGPGPSIPGVDPTAMAGLERLSHAAALSGPPPHSFDH